MKPKTKLPDKRRERLKAEKDADEALRQCLIRTYGYRCCLEGMGCQCGGRKSNGELILEVNHKHTRQCKRLRWDLRNVTLGCKGHNTWAHYNQEAWKSLWQRHWPEDILYIQQQSKKTFKPTLWDLKMIKEDFDNR